MSLKLAPTVWKSSWEDCTVSPLFVIWLTVFKMKVFSLQCQTFQFSFFWYIVIVIPLGIRWGVWECMCACVHVWAIWFFSLYACEADVKACAFSLPSLLCSAPARSEQSENKRGARGGESAPTVDLAIVGGGTLFPLMLWTHGWNPQNL